MTGFELGLVVRYLAWFVLASSMFLAGLYLKPRDLKLASKQYSLILRSLLANALIIPLIGLALYTITPMSEGTQTGFLLVTFSFGVPLVANFAKSIRADVPVVTVMIFALALTTSVTMPLLLRLVLPKDFSIAKSFFTVLLYVIVFQLSPLLLGLGLGKSQTVRQKVLRPLAGVTATAGIILIGLIVAVGLAAIYFIGVWAPIAMFALTIISLVVGWIMGGPMLVNRKVLALNSALRNFPIGLLMATSVFSNTEVALSVAVFAAIMILVVFVFARLISWREKREEIVRDAEIL